MKISSMADLKEADKMINGKALSRRYDALKLANKVGQYLPNYDALYECEYCPTVARFEGECPCCGEWMLEVVDLEEV